MENNLYPNLQEMCRLCLKENAATVCIFPKENNSDKYAALSIPMRLMTCAGLEVQYSDEFPKKICNECRLQLEKSYLFRKQSQASDAKLRKHLRLISTGKRSKVFVKKSDEDDYDDDDSELQDTLEFIKEQEESQKRTENLKLRLQVEMELEKSLRKDVYNQCLNEAKESLRSEVQEECRQLEIKRLLDDLQTYLTNKKMSLDVCIQPTKHTVVEKRPVSPITNKDPAAKRKCIVEDSVKIEVVEMDLDLHNQFILGENITEDNPLEYKDEYTNNVVTGYEDDENTDYNCTVENEESNEESGETTTSSDANEIKLKIKSGVFTTEKKKSRSEIYNVFNVIKDNEKVIKNFIFCTRCKNVYKFNEKSTSNLLRHNCYKKYKSSKNVPIEKIQPSNEVKNKCTELVVQWVVDNCRPFSIANDEGLLNLIEFCLTTGHEFGRNLDVRSLIPHSTMVSKNITSLYESHRKILKEDLNSVKDVGFSITCDLWTDNYLKSSYVGVTVHYIKDGAIIHKILGMERCTGTSIRNNINKLLMDFNCKLNDMVAIVTDKDVNMKAAFQRDRNIFCINHLINSVLEKAISNSKEVNALANDCSNLVNYFKKSGLSTVLNATDTYMPSRWNTVFYMLKSIQENWVDITQILQEKDETSRLANLNLTNIIEVIDVLKHFEEMSRLFEGEKYPTIHQVYPKIMRLKTVTSSINSTDSKCIKVLKRNIIHYMENIIDVNINIFHKIGLFLFPPANKLNNFDQTEKDYIHQRCKEMLKKYENAESVSNSHMEPVTNADDAFNDFVQIAADPDSDDEIQNEIIRYESQTILYYKDFDPLEWWNAHKSEYPLLYKLSSFVLATPASSAPSERLFSKARHLLSDYFNPIL